MKTLEEVIISCGDIEKIYRSDWQVTLWRAVALDAADQGANPLYPDLEMRLLANGRIREPDVLIQVDAAGARVVKAEEGRGTSLNDVEGVFGFKRWAYVCVPAGTVIPNELLITRDHRIEHKSCWHYSISPNQSMPVERFLRALDQLALNAGIQWRAKKHA